MNPNLKLAIWCAAFGLAFTLIDWLKNGRPRQ